MFSFYAVEFLYDNDNDVINDRNNNNCSSNNKRK